MATKYSFDVGTDVELQEVDNAVNQASKEVAQRYDFRGTNCKIEFDRAKGVLKLDAGDDFQMKSLYDVLETKLVKRKVPVKNLRHGKDEKTSGGGLRREITLAQGIPQDTAKDIVKAVKNDGQFKKTQISIQGDQLRVTSPSKDELQNIMAFLRTGSWDLEFNFTNYR